MGTICSSPGSTNVAKPVRAPPPPKWRRVLSSDDARKKYEMDGSLPVGAGSGLLELRGFLDDPILMKQIGMFGKDKKSFDHFMCWVDIQEFKSIGYGAEGFRRSKGQHIFQKYLKEGAPLRINNIRLEYTQNIGDVLEKAKTNRIEVEINLFDKIQHFCLNSIYNGKYALIIMLVL